MLPRKTGAVTETVTHRLAVEADIDEVLGFWRSSAEDTDRHDDRPSVELLLRRDPDALLLAVAGDEIIGTVIAGWDGWRCHLYRVSVRPDWRRRGVVRSLIAAAEQRFRESGARRADAMVLEGNDLGQAAWRALGYAPQPQWRRWVKRLDVSRR
jgi:ribosomal protein S18 acetylase RimI-like enzyme